MVFSLDPCLRRDYKVLGYLKSPGLGLVVVQVKLAEFPKNFYSLSASVHDLVFDGDLVYQDVYLGESVRDLDGVDRRVLVFAGEWGSVGPDFRNREIVGPYLTFLALGTVVEFAESCDQRSFRNSCCSLLAGRVHDPSNETLGQTLA